VSRAGLVVLGDALLDRDVEGRVERLSPDAPVPVLDEGESRSRPGGAALAAALAAGDRATVTLVTALGDDPAGRELAALLHERGIEVVDVGLDGTTPEKVRLCAGDRPLLRVDRGGGAPSAATAQARAAVGWADAVLVADYGRGMTRLAGLRDALADAVGRGAPVVWDPHPRGPAPVAGVALATPNAGEASGFAGLAPERLGDGLRAAIAAAHDLVARWRAEQVCVTCGADGAVLAGSGTDSVLLPAGPPAHGDPCGAGDRFASRAAVRLAGGAGVLEAVGDATAAASAFVRAGGAATVAAGIAVPQAATPGGPAAEDLVARVRSLGGRVVATGGCFDLLHPGHVHTLQAARRLGDCLVVLVNADASVRRLKGDGRPLVSERERAAVLMALACVDAVEIFPEDTPTTALQRLRPDVWVKGGDYAGRPLPEAEVLERWGGRVVVVPTLGAHSTTRIIEEAITRAV
jgi:rfaE bifunctional protein nucleotidyltransferase chain/domain/rfaE bifunctional protein kinase chain/domain